MSRYEIVEQIGHGAYSVVYKAVDLLTGSVVAIKRINHVNPDISSVLRRQIRSLQTLQHPNIIKLLAVYSDHCYTNLVFQYLPFDLIAYYKDVRKNKHRNLTHDEITYIVLQICHALSYMHERGIMHRDIKPENVLIDPFTLSIKLIDFGFATSINPYGQHTQYMITRWYRPLQIVLNLPYDSKVDVFALGALVLELYRGQEIFRSSSNLDQLYWILQICGFPIGWTQAILKMNQIGVSFSSKKIPQIYKMAQKLKPQAENLIIGMLQTNPHIRFTIKQIMQHPYFALYTRSQQPKYSINSNVKSSDKPPASRYRTTSNNFQQGNPRASNMLKSTQNYYSNNIQAKINNYNSPSNHNNEMNLNLHKFDFKRQNTTQLSTQRSKSSNNDPGFLLNQRRLSENLKQDRQYKFKTKLNRNDSQQTDFIYHHSNGSEINNDRSRYRTEGNQRGDKKYLNYYSNSNLNTNSYEKGGDSKYKFLDKYLKNQEQVQCLDRGLKTRTKSYQGINVVSHRIPQIKEQRTPRALHNENNKNFYPSAHQINNDLANGKKKEPTFTKIRDKFAITNNKPHNLPNGKIKISLTDRYQFQRTEVNYA